MSVESCAFSPDETYIAASGGAVFIWDVKSGRKERELAGSPHFCGFMPGGKLFVTMDNGFEKLPNDEYVETPDGERVGTVEVQVWIFQTWGLETVYQQPRHTEAVMRTGALSPDGRYLVAATDDKITVWDFHQEGEAKTYHEEMGFIYACAFAPNGKFFVSCDGSELSIWDIETWKIRLRHRCSSIISTSIKSCAVTPNADKIITAHEGGQLNVWDAETGQLLKTLVHTPKPNYHVRFPQTSVLGCAISPNGAWIASVGADHTVKLWGITTGQELAIFEGHTDAVLNCVFNPAGSWLASWSRDGQVIIWDIKITPQQRITVPTHTMDIKSCSFSSDGTFFVTASEDATAMVWNTETGALLHTLVGHRDEIRAIALSPDSTVIITGEDEGSIRVWNAHTGKELAVIENHFSRRRGIIYDCAFSPDGSWFISALEAHRLELCNAPGWIWERDFLDHDEDEIQVCAISPDSSWIASGGDTGAIKIWNPATGQLLHTLEGNSKPMRRCAVSPDGKFFVIAESDWIHLSRTTLVYGRRDRSLLVWDTSTWQLCLTLHFTACYIVACAITPNGKSIVAASDDGTIKLWDITSGQAQATFTAPDTLFCVAIHPWKPFAVAGGPGGAIYPLVLETIKYGPIIVTAHNELGEFVVHCPWCCYAQTILPDQLGHEIVCQRPNCQAPLQVNPFTLTPMTLLSTVSQNEGEPQPDLPTLKRSNRRGCWPFFRRS